MVDCMKPICIGQTICVTTTTNVCPSCRCRTNTAAMRGGHIQPKPTPSGLSSFQQTKMIDTFLTRNEIEALTDKVRRPAQIKVLNSIGIEHKVRPDGSIAILAAHVARVFHGDIVPVRRRSNTSSPNWASL